MKTTSFKKAKSNGIKIVGLVRIVEKGKCVATTCAPSLTPLTQIIRPGQSADLSEVTAIA